MIYDANGEPIEILSYCGRHQRPGYAGQCVLLKAQHGDRTVRHHWGFTLKADGGADEIDQEIDLADEAIPEGEALALAIREAD